MEEMVSPYTTLISAPEVLSASTPSSNIPVNSPRRISYSLVALCTFVSPVAGKYATVLPSSFSSARPFSVVCLFLISCSQPSLRMTSTAGPRMSMDWPVVRGWGERSMSVMMGRCLKPGWRASMRARDAPATPAPEMSTWRGESAILTVCLARRRNKLCVCRKGTRSNLWYVDTSISRPAPVYIYVYLSLHTHVSIRPAWNLSNPRTSVRTPRKARLPRTNKPHAHAIPPRESHSIT